MGRLTAESIGLREGIVRNKANSGALAGNTKFETCPERSRMDLKWDELRRNGIGGAKFRDFLCYRQPILSTD